MGALQVFEDRNEAQAFADHYNLANLDKISRGHTSPAVVDESTLPYYPAGTWRPTSTEVIDGTLVTPHAIGQD